jgi:hypothetical protein
LVLATVDELDVSEAREPCSGTRRRGDCPVAGRRLAQYKKTLGGPGEASCFSMKPG